MSEIGVLRPGIAIPTEFRGITYRSRLEANVAQFLFDMGLKFEYEARSFLVNGKHYAPDFYLPEIGRYVEARGYLTEDSEAILEGFVRQQGDLIVFYSDKAQQLQYIQRLGEIHRSSLVATLGTPSLSQSDRAYPCWFCKKFGTTDRRNITFLDVVMRSGVPVLVTEVGKSIQGLDAE